MKCQKLDFENFHLFFLYISSVGDVVVGTKPVTTLEEFALPPVQALDPFGDYQLMRSALVSLNVASIVLNEMSKIGF